MGTRTEIAVSPIVLFELWHGAAKSTRVAENTERIGAFLAGGFAVLDFDSEDARIAGEIRAELESAGTPIGPYDLLIAAQTIRRSATLVTANVSDFARVSGLRWEDWSRPS
jgi:tRNA(fMet)-specific endonuclease VapC